MKAVLFSLKLFGVGKAAYKLPFEYPADNLLLLILKTPNSY